MRRQVEHVARFQHELFLGFEVGQDLERQAFDQVQVLLGADAPAALALRLQQEHVIGIEVRADAAAVAGVAHHQVVQTGIRHEAELAQQLVGALVVQVDALDQHGPLAFAALRQFGQRTVLHVPLAAA